MRLLVSARASSAGDLRLARGQAEGVVARARPRPARDAPHALGAQPLPQALQVRPGAEAIEAPRRRRAAPARRRRPGPAPARTGSRGAARRPPPAASRRRSAARRAAPSTAGSRTRSPARQRQNASSPVCQACRWRTARSHAARASATVRLAIVREPRRLGARRPHRPQPLQGLRAGSPARAPRRATAAAPGSPRRARSRPSATSAMMRLMAARCGRSTSATRGVARLGPPALVEAGQRQPRQHVVLAVVEIALGGELDALGQIAVGIGEAVHLAAGRAEVERRPARPGRAAPPSRARARLCSRCTRPRSSP